MTDDARSRRPAEDALVSQLAELRGDLLDGLDSRADLLRWGQSAAVRSLGEFPIKAYRDLGHGLKPDSTYAEGPIVACLLTEAARTREMHPAVVEGVRTDWAKATLPPASTAAFRDMRANATEYVGTDDETDDEPGYSPDDQAFAMRPALEQLDERQRQCLDAAIEGFDGDREVLAWGDTLVAATRGETVDDGKDAGEWVADALDDVPQRMVLLGDEPYKRRAREVLIAHTLLPAFTRGVRDLVDRAVEEPTDDGSSHGAGDVA